MRLNGDARLNGDTDFSGEHFGYHSGRFRFGDQVVPRIAGHFSFNARHRIVFNYFDYRQNRTYTTEQDFDFEGSTIPAGSDANLRTKIALGSLIHDYTLKRTARQSLGLQVGIAWGSIRGRVHAHAKPVSATLEQERQGFAPVIGMRFSANNRSRKWHFITQGQYINADWVGLDTYTGDMLRLNALLEYRFSEHVGIHAGYDWFRLNVGRAFGQIDGDLVLRFMGPTLGLTLAF